MHASTTSKILTGVAAAAGAAALIAGPVQPASAASAAGAPTGITTISTGWSIPWGASWLPDGSAALVTERDSFKVFRVTPDGTRSQIGTVPQSQATGGEGGLMGVAVDPDWASNHHVYFMHTSSDGNRVARMTYDGSSLSGYKALVQGIKKATFHNGGRLAFGPDGHLYASTGDAQTPSLAQDRNSLNGKILRMTKDGKAAPGNPFGNLVFSMGHRNPQGLAFDAEGRLWSAELGQNSKDELNLIKSGRNYGWPQCEGDCSVSGMTNPKKTWDVAEASPSGIAIVDSAVYMASLRGERLWQIPISPDNENVGTAKAYYVGTYGRLRSVTKVPGADQMWLSTTNADGNGGEPAGADKIFRVTIG
ncbi:PQQ-dependent sugar dehydrogenase [Streptomyces sp. NPDC054841]